MNQLTKVFNGHELRIIEKDNEIWFVAKDVCDILGIKNSRVAVSRLDDDERCVVLADTPGGRQKVQAVNEFGLYNLVLTSRKPEAKEFKRLITSDNEIANLIGLEKSSITQARKRFGIETGVSVGRKGEMVALQKLESLGFKALDMNKINKLSEFDILVNDNLKIEVKSASEYKGRFMFTLAENSKAGYVVSDKRIRLANGKTRKLYSKTCDFLLFVGFPKDKEPLFWIIPSKDIPDYLQGISPSTQKRGKYAQYFNRFDLLEKSRESSEIA